MFTHAHLHFQMDTTRPGTFPSWHMSDEFEVQYPSIDGELRAAGVYIRVYLKDPKYALREPKRFIDETLRMFLGRAEEIVGKKLLKLLKFTPNVPVLDTV